MHCECVMAYGHCTMRGWIRRNGVQRFKIPMTAAAILLLAAGCGARQEQFTPAERMTAMSPEGFTAAEYDLGTKEKNLGEAKVWSNGAYRKKVRGEKRTVVHVGFYIENHTDQPMTLPMDQLFLDSATLDRNVIENVPPASMEGMTTIEPHGRQRIDAYFALPRGVAPKEVDAFQVQWKLVTDDLVYSQETPFLESPEERHAGAYYYTPFYDPFYYDPYIFHPRIVVHGYPYRHYHVFR